jgi:polysaccharide deacetylase 2 family uncharacterized protein YibQ
MTKRKKKKSSTSWAIKILIGSLVLLVFGVIGIVTYKTGFKDGQKFVENKYKKTQEKQKELLTKLSSASAPRNDLVGKLQEVLTSERKKEIDTKHEFDTNTLGHPPRGPKRVVKKKKIYSTFNRPKLAIIMDDVSFAHDVKSIKALKIPLTMSFLPPTSIHPDSAKLASREKIYMVHLPLEAMTFSAEETTTLHVDDSKETISQRVREIKKLFPRAYYVNNHTGSKFTSDKRAIKDLILALKSQGIGFLDSRTTAKTKVPEVMKSLGKPYIARDVFLDHEANVAYIEGQILKAIKKAKAHGTAIAIGHPRKETLEALRRSKKALQSVELVYINKII